MKHSKIIINIFLLIFLASCSAKKIGNEKVAKMYQDRETQLIKGKTTFDEILQNYGTAEYEWTDTRGNAVYLYRYEEAKHKLVSYIPFLFFKRIKADYYEIALTFNKKEKLVDKSIYSKIGITCGPHRCIKFDKKRNAVHEIH